MATGAISTASSTITPISGYCLLGEFRYGTNGSDPLIPEWDIGADATHLTTANMAWASDPENGLDTGWLSFSMSLPSGGGTANPAQLLLENAPLPGTLNYGGTTYTTMRSLQLRVAVQSPAAVSVTSLLTDFYLGSKKTESYLAVGSMNPAVDTRTSGSILQQILTVTPGLPKNDRLQVTGGLRFQFNAGALPSPNDLFVQLFAFTNSCTTPP